MLSVTVLIPAHNEEAMIGRSVRACLASTYPIAEVIVAADACTDATAQVAREAGARVVETNCKDKAGAQNEVLPQITTDLIAGFDGDTVPTSDCIERMVAAVEDGRDAVCATLLPIQHGGLFIRARRYAYALARRWWRPNQDAVGRIQVLTGAAYLFRTEAINAIGGFPTVGISADMDATWTLHRAGYKLGYVGKALAHTVDPDTFSGYRLQIRRWSAGYFQTMAKHRAALWHPRSILVVWTALMDLVMTPFAYVFLTLAIATNPTLWRLLIVYLTIHMVVTTAMVASVVGLKEALLGLPCYYVVNLYNKWVYLQTFFREWVLDSHYTSWTGRHGRKTVITPVRPTRLLQISLAAAVLVVGYWLSGLTLPPPLYVSVVICTVIPLTLVHTVRSS